LKGQFQQGWKPPGKNEGGKEGEKKDNKKQNWRLRKKKLSVKNLAIGREQGKARNGVAGGKTKLSKGEGEKEILLRGGFSRCSLR